MPLAQANLERQLQQASTELTAWVKDLDSRGVPAEEREECPKWRTLSARCHQLRTRLAAVSRIAKRDEDAVRRKAEKAAAAEAEPEPAPVEEKKPAKAKKPKKQKEAAAE